MKALIWIGCFFVAILLNTLLGYAVGFRAGYLLLYIVIYYIAGKLCKKWDEHKGIKENKNRDSTCDAITTIDSMPKIKFCRKCGFELIEGSEFCSNCGTAVVKE